MEAQVAGDRLAPPEATTAASYRSHESPPQSHPQVYLRRNLRIGPASYRAGVGRMTKRRVRWATPLLTATPPSWRSGDPVESSGNLPRRTTSPASTWTPSRSDVTYFYSEIDSTHPFREGNSRTLRQFSSRTLLLRRRLRLLDWEALRHKSGKQKCALPRTRPGLSTATL